jgi:hypothetical protein
VSNLDAHAVGVTEAEWLAAQQGGEPPADEPTRRRNRKGEVYDAELEKSVKNTATLRNWFYVAVLLVAFGGQVSGVHEALHVPLVLAVPVVAVLELGGMVILRIAENRRRLGESAVLVMALACAVGAFAVSFNWLAHSNHLAGFLFAFMSGLGFLVWVMSTEHRRRDRLRALGLMADLPPKYEFVTHWLRHPWVTLRARSIAKMSPGLGMVKSLGLAHEAMRRDRRLRGIQRVIKRKIRKAVDPITADIAINAIDPDRVAAEIMRRADYAGFTDLIMYDLQPDRIAAHQAAKSKAEWRTTPGQEAASPAPELAGQMAALAADVATLREELAARPVAAISTASFPVSSAPEVAGNVTVETPQLAAPAEVEVAEVGRELAGHVAEELAEEPAPEQEERDEDMATDDGHDSATEDEVERPEPAATERPEVPATSRPKPAKPAPSTGRSPHRAKVAAALTRNPDATAADLAARLRLPERTVRRHVADIRAAQVPINGHNHEVTR